MKYALLAVAALCGSPLMFAAHKGGLSGSSSAAKKSAAKKSGAKQPSAQNEPTPKAPKLDEPKGDGATTHNSQADAATGESTSPKIEQTRPAINPTETRDAITQDKPETQQSRATAHSGSGIGNKDMAAVPPANPDKANQKALDHARKDSAKNSPYNKAP